MNRLAGWFTNWKLLSLRTAAVSVFLLYVLAGFLVVPAVARRLIVDIAREQTGREVTLDEVRCNPFTLSLTIRGFSLPDRPGSAMLSFGEIYANAQLSSIFRWAFTLKDLRVEEPYVGLRRFADGGINILELMECIEERATEENEVWGGLPRLLLQRVLVRQARIEYEDRAAAEPVLLKLGPGQLELHNISTLPGRHGTDELNFRLERGGTLRMTGEMTLEPFALEGTASLEGIFLEHLWEVVREQFHFDVVSGSASGSLRYSARLEDDGPHVSVSGFDGAVKDLGVRLRDADVDLLDVPSISITGGRFLWPDARVEAAAVLVEGADARAWLEPDGIPSWAALIPEPTRDRLEEVYRNISEAASWVVSVGRLEITSSRVHFEDRTFDSPQALWVEDANLTLSDLSTEPGREWGLSGSVLLFGESPARAEGFFGLEPLHLEAEVQLSGLDISRAQPYIGRLAPVSLLSGTVSASGSGAFFQDGEGPAARFTGDLEIAAFELEEIAAGTRILQWDRVEAGGIEAAYLPMSLAVDTVDVQGARIDAVALENGTINLLDLAAAVSGDLGAGESTEKAAGQSPGAGDLPPIEVTTISLHDCTAAYTDRTLSPPFTFTLQSMNGKVTGVSTNTGSSAGLEIGGSVGSGGTVALEGEMNLFAPTRSTELSIDVRRTDLPPMSPMSVFFIGHPFAEGRADLDLDYRIADAKLEGRNLLVTRSLTLGDKVENQGLVNLPFKLGVSLLTDKDGLISLDIPISGDFDDPGFGIGDAIGQAAKTIIGEIVDSPFRLLGKLGGGSGDENLGFVEFAAGSSRLDDAAMDRLKILATGMEQRPTLILLVEGAWDGESDPIALREAQFQELLAERPETLELLESLYSEGHSENALAALRADHLAAAETEPGSGPVLDEPAYQRDLKSALVAALPVDQNDLKALGQARAEAVRSFFVDRAVIEPGCVETTEPVAASGENGDRLRCRLDVRNGSRHPQD